MGSAGADDSSQRAIEGDLLDVGNRLLDSPLSTDELLVVLQKAEGLLAQVWQQPPMSTCNAFVPIMKALVKEEIMHHVDVNIQVAVAASFSELSRISAPTDRSPNETKILPYVKEAMKGMDLDPDEYAETVTSLYHDVSNGENTSSYIVEEYLRRLWLKGYLCK